MAEEVRYLWVIEDKDSYTCVYAENIVQAMQQFTQQFQGIEGKKHLDSINKLILSKHTKGFNYMGLFYPGTQAGQPV